MKRALTTLFLGLFLLSCSGADLEVTAPAADDACSLQSTITYAPPSTGTYRLEAGCFGSGSCSASSIKVSF